MGSGEPQKVFNKESHGRRLFRKNNLVTVKVRARVNEQQRERKERRYLGVHGVHRTWWVVGGAMMTPV